MASVVSIAIAARNQAAGAFRAAQRQVSSLSGAVARSSFVNRQHTRTVRELVGVYRDASGQWYDAQGNMVAGAYRIRTVTTAYGRLRNAIQRTTRALITFTMVQRIANAVMDLDRIRGFAMTFGLLAAKIAAVIAVILPITGVIGNLIPLVMLIAPAAGTAGLALVGLKLAMFGVKEALDAGLSGDTEAFEKALSKLAPSAANAVRAIVKIRDQWKPLALDFQQRVFEGAGDELKALSNLIKPVADVWLPRLGNKFGAVRNQLAEGLASFTRSGQLEAVWRNLHAALSSLLDTAKPLARVFGDVLYVAAPRFAQLADKIRSAANAFSDWVRGAKESGKLGQWLDKAMTTFGKLKDIAVNLGTALAGIFRASSEGGDSFLDNLVSWTEKLSVWVNSGDGQKLIEIFSKVISALSQSAPVFGMVLGFLSSMVAWWGFLWEAAKAAWDGILAIAKFVIMWILNGYAWLLEGGAKAFGWVPGVGDKLKQASEAFNRFRDSVNNSLNGIQKSIDITVNYRARMIGPHLVSGSQQSGSYSSGIGGRAAGGPAAGLWETGENGRELIDFTKGMVYNSNETKRMKAEAGGTGGRGGVTVLQPVIEAAPGNLGAAFATIMKLGFQSNQLRMRVDSSGIVSVF